MTMTSRETCDECAGTGGTFWRCDYPADHIGPCSFNTRLDLVPAASLTAAEKRADEFEKLAAEWRTRAEALQVAADTAALNAVRAIDERDQARAERDHEKRLHSLTSTALGAAQRNIDATRARVAELEANHRETTRAWVAANQERGALRARVAELESERD